MLRKECQPTLGLDKGLVRHGLARLLSLVLLSIVRDGITPIDGREVCAATEYKNCGYDSEQLQESFLQHFWSHFFVVFFVVIAKHSFSLGAYNKPSNPQYNCQNSNSSLFG